MKMKKKFILIGISVLSCVWGYTQQTALNSQYLYNDFAINPAVAGSKNYSPLSLNVRRQWLGIDEAPVTQNLMLHGFLGQNTGGGFHFFNDASGPTRRTGVSTSFAYHVKTGKMSKLSFGVSGAITQFSIDRDKLITQIPGDVAVLNSSNQVIADVNFGILWKGDRHFIGVSGYNLIENKANINALTTPVVNTLDRVFYGHAGYNFKAGALIDIQPSAIFRYMLNTPFQFDGNLKVTLKDAYWIGTSYRHNDAIAVMGGIDLGNFMFGYTYDIGISDIKTYNDGTHEVFLGIKLNRGDSAKSPWKKRNRIYSGFSTDS